ncbi:hypothetical protein TD95_003066 [Thielaviopsis punctulata]|uniref:RecA family profile 1 domain-containing protein n=1 Tax=Thielaviopsis punctulata TaxID=72032 RepID=A0A0F4ZHT2_9PEZI|nr:hypothetical protein TD95_003066 [Thielaviopsis punctulata]
MSDLSSILPSFPLEPYSKLLQTLDHHCITTADLLSRDPVVLSSLTSIPILDIRRLSASISHHLQTSLLSTRRSLSTLPAPTLISTLDDALDDALAGGFPTGYISEITAPSGAGKTQLLLSLLLAVQMAPPRGSARSALYITTEAPLPTSRLAHILAVHPVLRAYNAVHPPARRVSLDRIAAAATPDIESQHHVLAFQVPVLIERLGVGLLVLDSVAANYRAEFARGSGALARRAADLAELGHMLRALARKYNIAVVVANQVADRFAPDTPVLGMTQAAALPPALSLSDHDGQAWGRPAPEPAEQKGIAALQLDHQQRFFTGWGDDPAQLGSDGLKTPALGLVWATQLALRVALVVKPVYGNKENDEGIKSSWRRWMKVVFAPHVAGARRGVERAVEYEIVASGVRGVGSLRV